MSLCRFLPIPSDRMAVLWSLLSVQDALILEYGPAGTTHYSIGMLGKLGLDIPNRLFTTHMSEDDVVMGDVKRLENALLELDRSYTPPVIFVLASSVSSLIGTDLVGVCNYMQERVSARLIVFENSGLKADYSSGLCDVYTRLVEEFAPADDRPFEPRAASFNILGASAGAYRMRSDVREIERLMDEAFQMKPGCHLCLDVDLESIAGLRSAGVNLVLRDEALPAARMLRERFGTPYVLGAPYGYAGTLTWLQDVAASIERPIRPVLMEALRKRMMEVGQYRMYSRMLRKHTPQAWLAGECMTVQGVASLLKEAGIGCTGLFTPHDDKALENIPVDVSFAASEREWKGAAESLRHHFVLADDVTKRLLHESNTFLRISSPVIDGADIARHLPIMGPRGADAVIESLEAYLQSLS